MSENKYEYVVAVQGMEGRLWSYGWDYDWMGDEQESYRTADAGKACLAYLHECEVAASHVALERRNHRFKKPAIKYGESVSLYKVVAGARIEDLDKQEFTKATHMPDDETAIEVRFSSVTEDDVYDLTFDEKVFCMAVKHVVGSDSDQIAGILDEAKRCERIDSEEYHCLIGGIIDGSNVENTDFIKPFARTEARQLNEEFVDRLNGIVKYMAHDGDAEAMFLDVAAYDPMTAIVASVIMARL